MSRSVALFDNDALRKVEATAGTALGDAFVLMARAGQAAWRQLLMRWPQARRIVVACGAGNNGGDGYVFAMHAIQAGRDVRVVRLAVPSSALAQRACGAFEAAGGHAQLFAGALPMADVVVDALFGIGLKRQPDTASSALIDAINAADAAVLALDVPSGVDAGSGDVPGAAVRADVTLQFLAPHCGLATGAALDHCGTLDFASLDIELGGLSACAQALDGDALADWLPRRRRDSHKGDYGHVLCIGGDLGSGGAIALCAEAALRSGAGLASLATRAQHVSALLARRPEAMVVGVETPGAIAGLLDHADVVAIGPGLGRGDWGRALWEAAKQTRKSLVVDADALNLLAEAPSALPPETILTPHPGEAARLLGATTREIQADRFRAAGKLVERFDCVVVLKGAGTIVAAPRRTSIVIAAGNPGMATGGMGDLLTGVIAAMRAQGLVAFDAACCGALLHAVSGDDAARDGGERGLLPSDLLPHLRRVSNR